MTEIQGRQDGGIHDSVANNHRPEILAATQIDCPQDDSNDCSCDHASPPLITVRESEQDAAAGNSDHLANARVAHQFAYPPDQVTPKYHFLAESSERPRFSKPSKERSSIFWFAEDGKINRLSSYQNGKRHNGNFCGTDLSLIAGNFRLADNPPGTRRRCDDLNHRVAMMAIDRKAIAGQIGGLQSALLMIGIGILILAYWDSPAPKQTARETKLANAQALSAEQLYSAYHNNEVVADRAYRGKALVIVGEVWSNDRPALGAISLKLAVLKQHSNFVRANLMITEGAKSRDIFRGFSVTLSCFGGGMVLGDPQLDECTIDHISQPPPSATAKMPR
jgi:hypothetical protein